MTEQEARNLVERKLASIDSDGGLVIVAVQAVAVGWVFFYDSMRHQQTRSVRDALLGNAPILVDRQDGSVHVTGTAHPVEYYVAAYVAARSQS